MNTNNTIHIKNNAAKITIKEQYEAIEIVGSTFNENLKYAYQANWEDILEKMENHINQSSPRTLSLYGKVILLSTLTMSKTSHLSIISPLDNQENNFIFLQKKKKKKKKRGVLNLLEP